MLPASTQNQRIGILALIMLITGAIDSIRNFPAMALFGSQLIFFFIFAALVFLIPVALVSAELSSSRTREGGIYSWVRVGLGDKLGFLAIWLQWINTMVWYPSILSFIAGTLVYFLNPELAQNKLYLIAVILGTFWLMTFVNLKGLKTSARFATFTTILGLIIPMFLIIGLALLWIITGKPSHLHLTGHNMLPTFNHSQSWISLTAIMAAFLGMELATVHVRNVEHPQKTFPKALLYSVLIIISTMLIGSLAIAMILPHDEINLVNGVMQTFTSFLAAFHLSWMMPVITTLILIGSVGSLINWIISPAKGLLQSAEHHFLPTILKKENKYGVARNLLITQAILVSLFCSAFLLMPSINGSYWLLTALSTQLYILMYVLMFIAAMVIKTRHEESPIGFKIPGGKKGFFCISILGLIGCTITLAVGFIPPSGINVGSDLHYETIFCGGMVLMILPVLFFYYYKKYYSEHHPKKSH